MAGKVLIVDDSPLVCGVFSNVLSQRGYETAIADNGDLHS